MNLPVRARIGQRSRRGPGQQASLFLRGIPFRHDREAVLTPVVDAMAARPQAAGQVHAAEGANRHCEPMGLATRDIRIFDWLDRYLAA